MEKNENYNNFKLILNKNAKEILDASQLAEQLFQLTFHGIYTPLNIITGKFKKLIYKRIYYIPVFQQETLANYVISNNKSNENWVNSSIIKNKDNVTLYEFNKFRSLREERRVKNIAIRAVYALNLDYGIVKIGVTSGEKPWVLYVNPNLESNKKMESLFEKAIKSFLVSWDKNLISANKKILIGCDPEFILQDSYGKMVLASTYLPEKGQAGCDRIWINHDRYQLPLAEIRPIPANEPRQLVLNLYTSLLICSKKITDKKLKWLAGSMPIKNYPLGGHIHLSNISVNSFLLRALDNYLTLVITLFEDENGIGRRPKYGFLGDYRIKYHGGFEYRTLPSWLVSPTITKGVFALTKLIADNYLYLYQNPLENINVQKAYYEGNKTQLKPIVLNLWNELKELGDYKLYEKYLVPLEKYINTDFRWNEKIDFREVWFLPPYHKNIQKNIDSKGHPPR